jgi:hypothetical protein
VRAKAVVKSRRRLLLLALALVAVAAVAAATSLPVFTVIVQKIGAGAVRVESPVTSATVRYVFEKDSAKRLVLTAVEVKFDKDLPSGTYIRVELVDEADNVVSAGEAVLSSALPANTWLRIGLETPLRLPRQAFSEVVVFVQCPQE